MEHCKEWALNLFLIRQMQTALILQQLITIIWMIKIIRLYRHLWAVKVKVVEVMELELEVSHLWGSLNLLDKKDLRQKR